MRSYLAQRAGVKPDREFFLLWALGLDLPGAVAVRPLGGEPWPSDFSDDDPGDGRRENAFQFSLVDVQLKFSAAKALLPEKLVLDAARETVALFHQYWNAEKANLPLSGDAVKTIEDHLKTVPLKG